MIAMESLFKYIVRISPSFIERLESTAQESGIADLYEPHMPLEFEYDPQGSYMDEWDNMMSLMNTMHKMFRTVFDTNMWDTDEIREIEIVNGDDPVLVIDMGYQTLTKEEYEQYLQDINNNLACYERSLPHSDRLTIP